MNELQQYISELEGLVSFNREKVTQSGINASKCQPFNQSYWYYRGESERYQGMVNAYEDVLLKLRSIKINLNK